MDKKYQSRMPLLLLIIINLLGTVMVMNVKEEVSTEIAVLCLGMCFINIVVYLLITLCRWGDGYLYIIISMLSSVGIIVQSRISLDNGIAQMKLYLIGVAGFFLAMLMYRIMHKILNKLGFLYFGVAVVLFVLTLVLAESDINGAVNWIKVGKMSFQPSEFIKILFVLTLAAITTDDTVERVTRQLLSKKLRDSIEKNRFMNLSTLLTSFVTGVCALFLLIQNEWGTMVLMFVLYLAFIYIYGRSRLYFLANVLAAGCVVFLGAKFMPHIQGRVEAWLNPMSDPSGTGWHILHSITLVAQGGFGGVGLGNAEHGNMYSVDADSVFSVICADMGAFGGVAVLMLFFMLVYRGFKISLSTINPFNKAVSMGLSVMLGMQTFIIVGGIIKLIPFTGITLPFISRGGSSMLATFIAVGILQSISSIKGEISDEIE